MLKAHKMLVCITRLAARKITRETCPAAQNRQHSEGQARKNLRHGSLRVDEFFSLS
jgi:hypothetical protein